MYSGSSQLMYFEKRLLFKTSVHTTDSFILGKSSSGRKILKNARNLGVKLVYLKSPVFVLPRRSKLFLFFFFFKSHACVLRVSFEYFYGA